jgi:hypothetical protein
MEKVNTREGGLLSHPVTGKMHAAHSRSCSILSTYGCWSGSWYQFSNPSGAVLEIRGQQAEVLQDYRHFAGEI